MSTYFVLYTRHALNGDADKTILVDSENTGEALYDDVVQSIHNYWKRIAGDLGWPAPAVEFTVKNIVCLGGAPVATAQNPLQVTHPSRPDLEISLYVSGVYNDRMDVNVRSKDTGETRSMCFELPADPRRL